MKRTIGTAFVAATLFLAACGSDTGGNEQPVPTDPPATTVADTAPAAEDPAALGDEIGRIYVAGYGEVVTLLADLKDSYIEQMVALGHRREALDAAERATVDARISSALFDVPDETFAAYQQAATDYAADTDVANLIADFNVIGQYANFDLLREQLPEEAARLGIG